MTHTGWNENVILADAPLLDDLALRLAAHFERTLNRPIPRADLARWADCAALDGGLRLGANRTQVVLLHPEDCTALRAFTPSAFRGEIDGQAFRDDLGEFTLLAACPEGLATMADFFVQSVEAVAQAEAVKRLVLVPAMEAYGTALLNALAKGTGKEVTLLLPYPQDDCPLRQEKLAYSLMAAMGIRGDELP